MHKTGLYVNHLQLTTIQIDSLKKIDAIRSFKKKKIFKLYYYLSISKSNKRLSTTHKICTQT